MNEVGIFSTNYTEKPTNKNIDVVFSPYPNVAKYTYQIYKDNKVLTMFQSVKYLLHFS